MPHNINPNYSAMGAAGAVRNTGSSMENSSSMGLSDKDQIQILLNEHKLMISSMTNCILECANPQLRQDCINVLNKDFSHQKMIWDAMNQRGWYQVQMASPQELQRAQQQLNQQQIGQQQHQQYSQQFTHQSTGQQHFTNQPNQQHSYMQQNYTQQPFSQSNFTQRP